MIEEKESTAAFNVWKFYLRRILRIWPLYFTVLLIGFVVYPLAKISLGYVNNNPYSPLMQILFLSNFDSIRVLREGLVDVAPMMIGITWSVAIEEQFYLVWPVMFFITKPGKFWIVCVLVMVGSFIFRQMTSDYNLYYHTLTVMSDLAIGALGACLTYYSPSFTRAIVALPRISIILIYLAGLIALMYLPELEHESIILSRHHRIISTTFFCFIIVEQNLAANSWFKFGNLTQISALGKYTYAFYMLHPLGIQTAIIIYRYFNIDRDANTLTGLIYSLISFCVSIILSIISYRFLESPFLAKKKQFY